MDELSKMDGRNYSEERREEVSGACYNFSLVVMDEWVNDWEDGGNEGRLEDALRRSQSQFLLMEGWMQDTRKDDSKDGEI